MVRTEQPLYMEPQEYRDGRESQLREWGSLIEDLRAKLPEIRAEVEEYYEQIEVLRAKQEEARRRLQELDGADEETWEELKASIDEAFAELERAVDRVASDIA
jgi:chromosome segregation ATPase